MMAKTLIVATMTLVTLGIPTAAADIGLNWMDCYPGQLHVHVWSHDACVSWPRVLSGTASTWMTALQHFVAEVHLR